MRSSRPFSASAGLLAVLILAAACATGSGAGLSVSDAWVRPTTSLAAPTAAYLTIVNASSQADVLLSVTSPAAASVEMHETTMDSSGMTGMQPIDRVEVAAGATVKLKPGGMHLMIMVTKALEAGGRIELDLVFEHAGTIVVEAEVRQG